MTSTIAGSSGFICGRNRCTSPSGVSTNFSKFHRIGPLLALDVLGLLQRLVERRGLAAVDLDLVEDREGDAPRHRAVLEDLVHRTGLLAAELVAREAEHGEAAVGVGALQLLELLVLGRQPALRGDVDDEQHLVRVVGERRSPAVGGLERDLAEVGERWPLSCPQAKPSHSSDGLGFLWENGRRDHRPRSRADPAHRTHRARRARRARADGGDHQHRLPAAVPRIRRRAVRQRDDHVPRARRAQRDDDAPDHPPRVRDAALDPALRRRPRDRRGRRAHPRRRGPRRSHRPELRMPRPEGDPQGRRSRSAVEARAVPRHRHARRPRRGRHPADDQDAQGHRLRSPHLPRRRAHRRGRRRRGRRAARPHRCRVLLGPGRLVGDRAAQAGRDERARAGQRRHLVRRRRRADDGRDRLRRRRRRARMPRPAVAVRRSRPRPRSRPDVGAGRAGRRDPRIRRRTRSAVMPSCSSSSSRTRSAAAATSASTSPGTSRATRSAATRAPQLATASSLAEIDELLATLDLDAPYPGAAAEGQRGRAGTPKRPALPDGWLDSRELGAEASCALAEAELDHSGG